GRDVHDAVVVGQRVQLEALEGDAETARATPAWPSPHGSRRSAADPSAATGIASSGVQPPPSPGVPDASEASDASKTLEGVAGSPTPGEHPHDASSTAGARRVGRRPIIANPGRSRTGQ